MIAAKMGARKVSVPLDAQTTVGALHARLLEAFSLPADASLRLLSRGKAVTTDGSALAEEAGLKTGSTIMVMHTRSDEIKQVQAAQGERMRGFAEDDERHATGSVSSAAGRGGQASRSAQKSSPYRFLELQPLSVLPEGAKPGIGSARARLQELSSDRAVLKILEEHQWTIGKLSEMPPEGLVGVSASCLMGLNKNKGEEILLRLRTDNWQGMRTYLSVVDVLLHELTHCVWGDHDNNFKALNSQLKMEYAHHRAREQRGQSAGGGEVFQREPDTDSAVDAGQQLGGEAALSKLPPASAAAAAAAARLGGGLAGVAGAGMPKQEGAAGGECEDCMED